MVVDDDKLIRDLTVTALTYCVNREVKSFGASREALEHILSGETVDIVISDVDMPEMNGFELMFKIREHDPGVTFIFMSGQMGYESRAKLAGASAFLVKPFEINDLFSIVECFVVEKVK